MSKYTHLVFKKMICSILHFACLMTIYINLPYFYAPHNEFTTANLPILHYLEAIHKGF
jgi:hypothetical protein